jgi:GAF domain-containing protein
MLGGVQGCMIFLWSDEEQVFTAIESSGLKPQQADALRHQHIGADAIPLLTQVRQEGKVVRAQMAEIAPYLPPPAHEMEDCNSVVVLPLRTKGLINGVMVATEPTTEPYLAEFRYNILLGIATDTSLALENARLYASQSEEAWVSSALLQVANTITISRNLEDILTSVVNLTPLLAGVNWSAVLMWDALKRAFFVAKCGGLTHWVREHFEGMYLPANLAPGLDTLTNGQVLALDPAFIAGIIEEPVNVTAWALRSPDGFIGLLLAGTNIGRPLNSRRLSIVAGIANQATLAIGTYQLYQRTLEQQRMERGIELAHDIQEGFLPDTCPYFKGWDIASECELPAVWGVTTMTLFNSTTPALGW